MSYSGGHDDDYVFPWSPHADLAHVTAAHRATIQALTPAWLPALDALWTTLAPDIHPSKQAWICLKLVTVLDQILQDNTDYVLGLMSDPDDEGIVPSEKAPEA